jgi:hypothetical protein
MSSEFDGRDKQGLVDADAAKTKPRDETAERAYYFALYGKLICVQAPAIAWALYFATGFVLAGAYTAKRAAKFAFLHEHDLGFVFLAWFMVYLVRTYAAINANGARAPARLGRPDQHVYKIMAKDGALVSGWCCSCTARSSCTAWCRRVASVFPDYVVGLVGLTNAVCVDRVLARRTRRTFSWPGPAPPGASTGLSARRRTSMSRFPSSSRVRVGRLDARCTPACADAASLCLRAPACTLLPSSRHAPGPAATAGLLLNAAVFGAVVVPVVLLYAYGRVAFCNLYKADLNSRGAGFKAAVVAEHVSAALVGICALKGILGPAFPF